MKPRETVVPLGLFALAFVVALLANRQPGSAAREEMRVRAPQGVAAAGANVPRTARDTGGRATDPREPAEGGVERRTREPVEGSIERSTREPVEGRIERSTREADTEQPFSAPATIDAPPAVQAVDAAVDVPLAVETLDAATDTLKNSLSPDDRVRALRALAATGRDGVEVARVRDALHLAATDDDPDVAARAREEYEALVEREDR